MRIKKKKNQKKAFLKKIFSKQSEMKYVIFLKIYYSTAAIFQIKDINILINKTHT